MSDEYEEFKENEREGEEVSGAEDFDEFDTVAPEGRLPIPHIRADETLFDNEFVRFLDTLLKDSTTREIAEYILRSSLSIAAKEKLILYAYTLLHKEFAITRLRGERDLHRILIQKSLIDADLPLGLTKFDLTPEFHHIVGLITIKFQAKLLRSMDGFERIALVSQRQIVAREELMRMDEYELRERLKRYPQRSFLGILPFFKKR
ncbi:MAG: hypothetical protein EJNHJLOP_00029 [Methanophagales virus PBV082]|uniref:Uncharacterized protein n=1 Tax=Methanophagales virus PBV082 TaxID=3071307 RepID=A0AA46TDH2_9VIRU|nr:MAG: hypothetical protein QIT52_gp29 [Methanophagales virus PBV082]UYL64918.1 MAG: hypothetical protein EJNHJLOP_00029 [Methanophagales virus PBV082]